MILSQGSSFTGKQACFQSLFINLLPVIQRLQTWEASYDMRQSGVPLCEH